MRLIQPQLRECGINKNMTAPAPQTVPSPDTAPKSGTVGTPFSRQ